MGFQLNDWVKLVDGDYTTVTHSTFQELHTVEAVDLDDHWYSLLGFNKVYYNDKDLSEGFYWNLPLHSIQTWLLSILRRIRKVCIYSLMKM